MDTILGFSMNDDTFLQELFGVPGGEGRILNIDESMTYRYDQDKKSWTY